MIPPLLHPIFGVLTFGQIAYVGVSSSIYLWNYFRSIATYVITVPERHRRTDTQTYCDI